MGTGPTLVDLPIFRVMAPLSATSRCCLLRWLICWPLSPAR